VISSSEWSFTLLSTTKKHKGESSQKRLTVAKVVYNVPQLGFFFVIKSFIETDVQLQSKAKSFSTGLIANKIKL
jgi:hypothetical protein